MPKNLETGIYRIIATASANPRNGNGVVSESVVSCLVGKAVARKKLQLEDK